MAPLRVQPWIIASWFVATHLIPSGLGHPPKTVEACSLACIGTAQLGMESVSPTVRIGRSCSPCDPLIAWYAQSRVGDRKLRTGLKVLAYGVAAEVEDYDAYAPRPSVERVDE